jgi:hypothetical protein
MVLQSEGRRRVLESQPQRDYRQADIGPNAHDDRSGPRRHMGVYGCKRSRKVCAANESTSNSLVTSMPTPTAQCCLPSRLTPEQIPVRQVLIRWINSARESASEALLSVMVP